MAPSVRVIHFQLCIIPSAITELTNDPVYNQPLEGIRRTKLQRFAKQILRASRVEKSETSVKTSRRHTRRIEAFLRASSFLA